MEREKGWFNWQMLGKADYSQSAAFVASLPKGVKDELGGNDERLLTKIFYLCWLQASHSGRGSAYCWPAQGTMGKDLRRSARTIERYLGRLKMAGLVVWKRLSPIGGKYRTCIYSLGKNFLAALYARYSKTMFRENHTTKTSYNDLKKGNISPGCRGGAYNSPKEMKNVPSLASPKATREGTPPHKTETFEEFSALIARNGRPTNYA